MKNCALALSPADVCCDIDFPRRVLFGTDKARVMTWALDTQQTQNKATQFQVCFIKLSETGAHTGADTQAHTYVISLRGGGGVSPRRRLTRAPRDDDRVV